MRLRVASAPYPCIQFLTVLLPVLPVWIFSTIMGDPSFGSSPPAESEVRSQSFPFLVIGIRPFLQAPPLGALPGPATFAFSLPVALHAEVQGSSPLSLGTGGPSCQVPPLSVGQPLCPSIESFEPTTVILLSGRFAPLPQGSSMVSHAGVSPSSPTVASRPLSAIPRPLRV